MHVSAPTSVCKVRAVRSPRRLTSTLGISLLAVAAVSGCGRTSGPGGVGSSAPVVGAKGSQAKAAPALGFPVFATKNTTRVGGADPVADAAAIARAVYPSAVTAARPRAVALVDGGDWRAALAASVFMSSPLRAPVLFGTRSGLPDATKAALAALAPTGAKEAGKAQIVRVGDVAGAPGLATTAIVGTDDFALARAIDAFQAQARGSSAGDVLVVSADRPAYAMPAAAWAAKSGDPILFTGRDSLPSATRAALVAHGQPHIYVLGPASVIGAPVIAQLRKLGTVTRISGADAQSNAIAFARFSDGDFGWDVTDPGHGLLFANPGRPADAAAVSPLASSGEYGPLLLTAPDGSVPAALSDYLLDIQPGYTSTSDPSRGVYNHGWIVGDDSAVTAAAQAQIDGLLEISPVTDQASQNP